MHVEDTEYYKIGIAIDVEKRYRQIQANMPFPLKVLYHVRVGDSFNLEQQLHKTFAKQRVRYEWFQLNARQVQYIITTLAGGSVGEKEENTTTKLCCFFGCRKTIDTKVEAFSIFCDLHNLAMYEG